MSQQTNPQIYILSQEISWSNLLEGIQNNSICGSGEQEGQQNISNYCLESQSITSPSIHYNMFTSRETEWDVQNGIIMYILKSCPQNNYTHFSRPHPDKSLYTLNTIEWSGAGREMGVGNEDKKELMNK